MNKSKAVQTVNFVTPVLPRDDPNPSRGHPNTWAKLPQLFGETNARHAD
jgi:hypothetical protein